MEFRGGGRFMFSRAASGGGRGGDAMVTSCAAEGGRIKHARVVLGHAAGFSGHPFPAGEAVRSSPKCVN